MTTRDPSVDARDTLSAAVQFFRKLEDRVAKAAGMTAVEARTLVAVDQVGLTRGITEVGWLTGVLQPAATASVRRLETRKLVGRAKRHKKGTRAALMITDKGRAQLDTLQALEHAAYTAMLKALPAPSRKELLRLLDVCVEGQLGPIERALVTRASE